MSPQNAGDKFHLPNRHIYKRNCILKCMTSVLWIRSDSFGGCEMRQSKLKVNMNNLYICILSDQRHSDTNLNNSVQ